jgi:hypothetical protein
MPTWPPLNDEEWPPDHLSDFGPGEQAPPDKPPTEMMKCGHAANATMNGKPVCAICFMATSDDAATIVVEAPDLSGRRATCSYRTGRDGQGHDPQGVPSSVNLAFFEYLPNQPTDQYYCGCWGWD